MLMGVTEYVRHRGCTLQEVRHALELGHIVRLPNGQIDSDAADRSWKENEIEVPSLVKAGRPSAAEVAQRQVVTVAEPGITYSAARALSQVYVAQQRKLVVEKLKGELVSRAEVDREAAKLYRGLRDAFLNLPARLSSQLAVETDPSKVFHLLDGDIRRILSDFADGKI